MVNLNFGLLAAAGAATANGTAGEEERESRDMLGPLDISLDTDDNRGVSRGLAAGPTLGCRVSDGFVGSAGEASTAGGVGCGGDTCLGALEVDSLSFRLKEGRGAAETVGATATGAAGGCGATK